jgi:hypothetical protein
MRFLTKYFRALALLIATMALVGCANVPKGTVQQDLAAKQFTPQAETASLYIYRDEIFGAAVPMTVTVNNQHIGQSGPKSYFYLNVAPGQYNIESVAENTASVTLDVEAAKNYFVWQEVKMGFAVARTHLTHMDEVAGRKGVMASEILATKPGTESIQPAGGRRAPVPVAAVAPAAAPAAVPAPVAPHATAAPVAPQASAAQAPATAPVAVVAMSPAIIATPISAPAPAKATTRDRNSKEERLKWLQRMQDNKLVTQEYYDAKRKEILSAP